MGGNMFEDGKKILKNSVKCRKCGDIIQSCSESAFTACKCGQTKISGGFSQLIREGVEYDEMSQFFLVENN
jgi:hypothetical protein